MTCGFRAYIAGLPVQVPRAEHSSRLYLSSGKAHWHVLLRARAIETGFFVVAPAQCGTHVDGRRTYGHAMNVSPWSEILAEVPTDDTNAAAGANDGIIHATLDPAAITAALTAIPSLASNPDFS